MMPSLEQPSLWQRLRFWWAFHKWCKTPLGFALVSHTQRYFHTESKLRFFERQNKERLIEDFYRRVFLLPSFPNAHAKFREELADCVLGYADMQVLCLKPEEKASSFYSDARYVSGELHRHIRACAEHNDELKRVIWEHPGVTDDELVDIANTRSAVWLYYANGFNLVRSEFNERVIEGKDWFRPFVVSAMIFAEDTYRSKIGLPSLFDEENFVGALEHSTFTNIVLQCKENPLFEWEQHYGKHHIDSI